MLYFPQPDVPETIFFSFFLGLTPFVTHAMQSVNSEHNAGLHAHDLKEEQLFASGRIPQSAHTF